MPVNSATNAVFAKSRSKLGKCLTQKNYTDLSALNNIPEVVAYLKQHTWYKDALASVKDSAVHRGNLEKILYTAVTDEISGLCSFEKSMGSEVMRFIDYKEQAKMILTFCRYFIAGDKSSFITDVAFGTNFEIHPLYNSLISVNSFAEIGTVLKNTVFQKSASLFSKPDEFNYPLVEAEIYKTVFDIGFDSVRKYLHGTMRDEMYDLLALYTESKDIQMICRQKRFETNDTSRPELLLIGRRALLNERMLTDIINAPTIEASLEALWKTPYNKYKERFGFSDFSHFMDKILYVNAAKKIHYSQNPCVVLFAFIIILEIEYYDLTTIIEGIRYSFKSDKINNMLISNI